MICNSSIVSTKPHALRTSLWYGICVGYLSGYNDCFYRAVIDYGLTVSSYLLIDKNFLTSGTVTN